MNAIVDSLPSENSFFGEGDLGEAQTAMILNGEALLLKTLRAYFHHDVSWVYEYSGPEVPVSKQWFWSRASEERGIRIIVTTDTGAKYHFEVRRRSWVRFVFVPLDEMIL